ncbi:MAG: AMP-binding protein [Myxococcota bacterium]
MTEIHEGPPLADFTDDQLPLQCVYRRERERPDAPYLTQPIGGGAVDVYTFGRTVGEARRLAAYLRSLELPAGSRIALVTKNCAHHFIWDLAIWMAGHVSVSIYPTVAAETLQYVLEHSEAKLLFVGKLDVWDEMASGVPEGLPLVRCALSPELDAQSYEALVEAHAPIADDPVRDADDVVLLCYTSGSTGKPKGAMITARASIAGGSTMGARLGMGPEDRLISYLPLAHAFERGLLEIPSFQHGFQVFFAESLDTFIEDVQRAKPTVFQSVPRLWIKFKLAIEAKMPPARLARLLKMPLVGGLVRGKILRGLGLEKVRVAGSGTAPIPGEVLEFYDRLGLTMVEGYAMTENWCAATLGTPGRHRVGTVGEPVAGTRFRISASGEIEMQSPGMMNGYFKQPEVTAATFTEDGWLKTGDRGAFDDAGSLRITGRVKELFKTSKGKYVAPAPIENLLNTSPGVELSCVMGRGLTQPIAVVQLDEATREAFASDPGRVEAQMEDVREAVNAQLEKHERLDRVIVSAGEWTIASGLLTPTMKIRRAAIEERHADLLNAAALAPEGVQARA